MSSLNTVEELLAEVKSDLSKYDDAGLIDEISVYRDIIKGLKRFGNDLLEIQETVVDVVNNRVSLPETFASLYIAYLCEPLDIVSNSTVEKHFLQESNFYIEKTERDVRWNSCEPCCTEENEKVITEKLYFKDVEFDFRYKNPTLLQLAKPFNKESIHDKCRNKYVTECPYEIMINRTTLHTNFKAGAIYMQYYGLPLNEDGEVMIPSTQTGHLDTYLEYFVKRRLAERLLGNNDAVGLASLYTIYKGEENVALRNASAELKMGNINPTRYRLRAKRLNRIEAINYSLNF